MTESMTEDNATAPHPQATVDTATAAELLSCTTTWVRKLLDDPKSELKGPPSNGRGKPRFVYAATIPAARQARATTQTPPTGPEPGSTALQAAHLQVALLQGRLADTTTALQHSNVASEKLREALKEQQRAFQLSTEANQANQNAINLLVQADAARQEALGPFSVEDPPS